MGSSPGKGRGSTRRQQAGGSVAPRSATGSISLLTPSSSGEPLPTSPPSLEELPQRIAEARSKVLEGKQSRLSEADPEARLPDPREKLSEAEVREVGEVTREYVEARIAPARERYEEAVSRREEASPALERQREYMDEQAQTLYGPVEVEYPDPEPVPEVPEPYTVTIAERNAALDARDMAEARNNKAMREAEQRAAKEREQRAFRYRSEHPDEEAREDALVSEAVASTNERAAALEELKQARREATLEAVGAAHEDRLGSPDSGEAHRWAKGSNRESRRHVEEASSAFPSSWIESSRARGGLKAGSSDGTTSFYRSGGPGLYRGEPPSTILLAGGAGTSRHGSPTAQRKHAAAVHELCHRFEDSRPHLKTLQARFLDRRAADSEPVSIGSNRRVAGHSTNETARDGGFFDPYCGKEYSQGHREIISMGYTAMVCGDERFERARDSDYESFVYGVMSL